MRKTKKNYLTLTETREGILVNVHFQGEKVNLGLFLKALDSARNLLLARLRDDDDLGCETMKAAAELAEELTAKRWSR